MFDSFSCGVTHTVSRHNMVDGVYETHPAGAITSAGAVAGDDGSL